MPGDFIAGSGGQPKYIPKSIRPIPGAGDGAGAGEENSDEEDSVAAASVVTTETIEDPFTDNP